MVNKYNYENILYGDTIFKGSNQKLKLSYLTKIMLEKTDDE